MRELLESGMNTGGADVYLVLANNWLSSLGIQVDPDKMANKAEFERVTTQQVLESLQKFKGSTSERELDFARKTVANLGKTPEANIKAVAAMLAMSEISLKNAATLAKIGDFEQFKEVEIAIAEKSADDITKRTKEIESEMTAKREATVKDKTEGPLSEFHGMTREKAVEYVRKQPPGAIDKLPVEQRKLLQRALSRSQ
jgi:hypothetical protein